MLSGWRLALRSGEAAFKAAAVVSLTAFMAFSTVPSSAWAEQTRRDDVSPGFNHDAWNDIRDMLYEGQTIEDGKGVISLTAPYRAEDAAIVPITIAAAKPQTKGEFIESITLVIDQNPSPVAAVFHLTPDSGLATIDTRIRINAFTDIRAIARMNDGRLFMTTEFIKAAGGCSTPGLSEMDEAIARAGKMKMKFLASDVEGAGGQAQLLIRHPNFSGLQMDQISGFHPRPLCGLHRSNPWRDQDSRCRRRHFAERRPQHPVLFWGPYLGRHIGRGDRHPWQDLQ